MKSQSRIISHCKFCNREFFYIETNRKETKFCSRICYHIWRKNEIEKNKESLIKKAEKIKAILYISIMLMIILVFIYYKSYMA